jgi:hypothetical protein
MTMALCLSTSDCNFHGISFDHKFIHPFHQQKDLQVGLGSLKWSWKQIGLDSLTLRHMGKAGDCNRVYYWQNWLPVWLVQMCPRGLVLIISNSWLVTSAPASGFRIVIIPCPPLTMVLLEGQNDFRILCPSEFHLSLGHEKCWLNFPSCTGVA